MCGTFGIFTMNILRVECKLSRPLYPKPFARYSSKILTRLFKIDACAETDAEFVWIYRCESDGPFQLHPDEIETGGWFAPEKVTSWIAERPQDFATAFVLIWEKLLTAKTQRRQGKTIIASSQELQNNFTARSKSPGATGR